MNSYSRYLKVAILFGLGIFLIIKIVDGSLYFYISKRFAWLTLVGAFCFLTLAFATLRESEPHHTHEHHIHEHNQSSQLGVILITSIPLLLGFLLPAQPLDTNVIQNKGLSYTASFTAQDNDFFHPPSP